MKILKLPKRIWIPFFPCWTSSERYSSHQEREKSFAFDKISNWSEVNLDYNRTILPPKKYFLKP